MAEKILVVDDDPSVRDFVVLAIKRLWPVTVLGCEMMEAASGEEGLEIINTGNVGLVFSDNNMPGLTGLDMLRQATTKPRRAIVASGHFHDAADDVRQHGPPLERFALVAKPISLMGIAQATTNLVAERLVVYNANPDLRHQIVEALEGCGFNVATLDDPYKLMFEEHSLAVIGFEDAHHAQSISDMGQAFVFPKFIAHSHLSGFEFGAICLGMSGLKNFAGYVSRNGDFTWDADPGFANNLLKAIWEA